MVCKQYKTDPYLEKFDGQKWFPLRSLIFACSNYQIKKFQDPGNKTISSKMHIQ